MKILIAMIFFSSFLYSQNREMKKDNIWSRFDNQTSSGNIINNNYADKIDSSITEKPNYNSGVPAKEIFPSERIFPKFYADGTALQFSLSKNAYTKRWIGSIGDILRLYQVTYNELKIQIGLGSTVYASLIRKPDVLDVQTAGFFLELPVEFRFSKKFALRTGYGHYSAHLVDDGIEDLHLHSINYAKDYIPLFAAYGFDNRGGWIYGGVRFDTYTIPEYNKRWNIQAGIEGGNYEITRGIKLYGAADIKIKSEAAWATTQSYQIGLKILEKGPHAVRIAYTYRTGIDDRGQFYTNRIKLSIIGVYFDL